jgi:tetratricopeptide (TPR) repeat protein
MSQDRIIQLRLQAEALISAGRAADAASLLTQGLSLAPQDYGLLCLMGQALIADGKLDESAKFAEKALATFPDDCWAHRLRSVALRQSRRYESLESAKEAVRLDPNEPANWHTLASAQLQVFNLKEARASAERLLVLAPSWDLTHQVLFLVASKEENYKEAEQHCRRELELNPNSYHGMNNLGVALLNQGRKRQAVEIFYRAAKINPAGGTARKNLMVAATKYVVPRVGVSIGVLILLAQLVRLAGMSLGGNSDNVVIVPLALFIAGGFAIRFGLRWYRIRRMPGEVREYMNLVTEPERTRRRREYLRIVCWASGALLAISVLNILMSWGEIPSEFYLIAYGFPLLMLLVFALSMIALLRKREHS